MPEAAATLNALLQATRDSLDFYTDAVNHVANPQLKALFRGMLDAKHQLISALADEVRVRGEMPAPDHTLAGNLRKLYADIRTRLSDDADTAYVAELERSEARLLDAFEQSARGAADATVRGVIEAHLPRVRRCHEEMCRLRRALAA